MFTQVINADAGSIHPPDEIRHLQIGAECLRFAGLGRNCGCEDTVLPERLSTLRPLRLKSVLMLKYTQC